MSEKILFFSVANMESYSGPEEDAFGSTFLDAHGYGLEIYNFKNDDGMIYGHSIQEQDLTLTNVSHYGEIQKDEFGEFVDGVTVCFYCKKENSSSEYVIAGFYRNARVYAKAIRNERQSRYLDKIKSCLNYRIVCNSENAFLIKREERSFVLPRATKSSGGFGQSFVWYANQPKDEELLPRIKDYINSVEVLSDKKAASLSQDEIKYIMYDESKKTNNNSSDYIRNEAARKECLDYYGSYKCQICDFDFKEKYGDIGEKFIEVHHIKGLAEQASKAEYQGTNPHTDLIPVCPNCHAMLHKQKPPISPEALKNRMKTAKNN